MTRRSSKRPNSAVQRSMGGTEMIRMLRADDAGAYVGLRREALLDSPLAFGASPADDFASSAETIRDRLGRGPEWAILGAFEGRLVALSPPAGNWGGPRSIGSSVRAVTDRRVVGASGGKLRCAGSPTGLRASWLRGLGYRARSLTSRRPGGRGASHGPVPGRVVAVTTRQAPR